MTDITKDLVVVGATLAGHAAAAYAADAGMSVAIIEETGHDGGLSTGGLGKTDVSGQPGSSKNTRWGRTLQYYKQIGTNAPYNLTDTEQINFGSEEAKTALAQVFMTSTAISLRLNAPLKSVTKNPDTRKITSIAVDGGDTYSANFYCDAHYAADLAVAAGVPATGGRDSATRHNERVQFPDAVGAASWPGLNRTWSTLQNYRSVDAKGNRYPHRTLAPGAWAKELSGSARNQAYGFRHTVSSKPNRIPWSALLPYLVQLGYRDADFMWVADMYANGGGIGAPFPFGFSLFPISGTVDGQPGLYTTNGGDLGGLLCNGWGQHSPAERRSIEKQAFLLSAGALYFASTNAAMPQAYRDALNVYGLPAEEFQTDFIGAPGWPSAYYVRQDRNARCLATLTTHGMFDDGSGGNWNVLQPVMRGGYQLDLHDFFNYATPDLKTREEGDTDYTGVKQYSLSIGHGIPSKKHVTNLGVVWGIGASTLGMSSYRMEPTAALFGQAMGMQIGLANTMGVDLADVPYSALLTQLNAAGAVLAL